MKKMFTIAMMALSVGAFAQQRQMVRTDNKTYQENRYQQTYNSRYGNFNFSRLYLTSRQERQLVALLKDKQTEERTILKKYRNPQQKLRMLDREYDRKIQNLLSRSQYDKWSKIYAYQYEAYGNKRWS
ncbi:hypothetical protein SAMN02927937_02923 [Paenimyroides aquimaris]|uniref:DUF4890 domain-containing protein n=1 Tax=Paenimyroides marinum TaxID=1159016 RepID=A0A1H6MQV4_9FLAO|nr:hypothetical protein [Paenimyroides aquimaris]SEI04279.1 hypothetical protein SAMN02927937_02923 [Paenimyroides aquimaris]